MRRGCAGAVRDGWVESPDAGGTVRTGTSPERWSLLRACSRPEHSAECLHPCPKVAEAHAPRSHVDVEPASVVVDLEEEPGVSSLERDPAGGGCPVPADVRECFTGQLHHVSRARGEHRRSFAIHIDDGHDAGACTELAWYLFIQGVNAALVVGIVWLAWPTKTMVGT
jgi:hypothetical protein